MLQGTLKSEALEKSEKLINLTMCVYVKYLV
ncbi:hypothetical protein VULLAG_LOCUS6038 [Vulpes lagopus]